jgi:5-hydroxyisourate hydrolase-like protein (transthyretin family)
MKTAAVAVLSLLFLVSTTSCYCSVAVNEPPKTSSGDVRITTLLDGKPYKGVKIEIYRYRKEPKANPLFTFMTNEGGSVTPPALSRGDYWIVASAGLNLRADLYLRVASRSEGTSSFSMELDASPYPTFEQRLSAAEQMPIKAQIQRFGGTVHDQSGSVISGVSIDVVRKGSQGRDHVIKLKSDRNGRFSATLSEGRHIAIFQAAGFSTQFIPLEIAMIGGNGEIRVELQIAPSR